MADEVLQGYLETVRSRRFRNEAHATAARALRRVCPIDTGALQRSIRAVPAGVAMLEYGRILNAKGRHQGWIDRVNEGV